MSLGPIWLVDECTNRVLTLLPESVDSAFGSHDEVNVMSDVASRSSRTPTATPDVSKRALVAGKVHSISRRAWSALLRVVWDDTGGGIDETALPSGFAAPQRRGSRMVRNLWHIPF